MEEGRDLIPAATRRISRNLINNYANITPMGHQEIIDDVRNDRCGALGYDMRSYVTSHGSYEHSLTNNASGRKYKHSWKQARDQSYIEVNRNVLDSTRRAMHELSANPELIDEIGFDKAAELIGYAANRLNQDRRRGEIIEGNRFAGKYVSLPAQYGEAAKQLINYLKYIKQRDNNNGNGDGESCPQDQQLYDFNTDEEDDNTEQSDNTGNANGGGNEHGNPENGAKLNISESDFIKYLFGDIDNFEALSTTIDNVPELALRDTFTLIRDDDGNHVEHVRLDPNKMSRMLTEGYNAMAVPNPEYFGIRYSNGDLLMRENYHIESDKPIELIVIDASGSMSHHKRAERALAYMFNRLNKVIEGKLICAFAMFTSEVYRLMLPDKTMVIDNAYDAERAKLEFTNQYTELTERGSTDIALAVSTAYEIAEAMSMTYATNQMVSITIITDDDSSSGDIKIDKRFVLNCLAVADNAEMRHAVRELNGVYLPLNIINA